MRENGFKNVTGDERIPVIIGGMTLSAFLKIFRKWIFFSQSGLPAAFKTAGWMRALAGFGAWATLIIGVVATVRHGFSPATVRLDVIGVLAIEAFVSSQVRLSKMIGGAAVKPQHCGSLRHYRSRNRRHREHQAQSRGHLARPALSARQQWPFGRGALTVVEKGRSLKTAKAIVILELGRSLMREPALDLFAQCSRLIGAHTQGATVSAGAGA